MNLNTQKEDFSYAYIYAVSSSIGYSLQTEDSLCLKRCAYWLSLRGRPPLEEQTTIIIEIPRQNIFSPNALKIIMERIAAGENL